jgi:arsenate reductase
MKLYSYNKCGTCRKAKNFLDASGVSYEEVDITETPPPNSSQAGDQGEGN